MSEKEYIILAVSQFANFLNFRSTFNDYCSNRETAQDKSHTISKQEEQMLRWLILNVRMYARACVHTCGNYLPLIQIWLCHELYWG